MIYDDVWIQGTGQAVGELRPVPPAIHAHCGMESVSWSDLAGPELAVAAGREALAAAGGGVPDLHLHGAFGFTGIDLWPVSCWVADQLFGQRLPGLSLQVSALCNTSVAVLELAGTLLAGRERVLLTLGDRFPESAVDRFQADPEIVLGDGGSAAVVGRGGGLCRLVASSSLTDPSLEGLQRGDEPFREFSPAGEGPLVVRKRTQQFFAGGRSPRSVVEAHVDGVRTVVESAMKEAGMSLAEARWVIPPFVGTNAFEHGYRRPLGLDPERTLFAFGRRVGHLGGSDHLVALDHLHRSGSIATGDRLVLVGVGAGFTFSCLVLEAG